MNTQYPKIIRVLQDSREKRPLIFPGGITWHLSSGRAKFSKIEVVKQVLATADYSIQGYEHVVLIERKGGMRELHTNLISRDRSRFFRCLDRLALECEYPYILVDASFRESFQEPWGHAGEPTQILDRLFYETAKRGVRLLWLSAGSSIKNSTRLGEFVVRLMWQTIVSYREKQVCVSSS